jgi:hypothetical protein
MKGRGQGVARISGYKLVNTPENKDLVLAIENPIQFFDVVKRRAWKHVK